MRRVSSLAGLLLLLVAPYSSAVLIDFSFDSVILEADRFNKFGLSAGDVISVAGTFDSNTQYGGFGPSYRFNQQSGNKIRIQLGDIVLDETNEVGYYTDGPILVFYEGHEYIDQLLFSSEIGLHGAGAAMHAFYGYFWAADSRGLRVYGDYFRNYTQSERVPEPMFARAAGNCSIGNASRPSAPLAPRGAISMSPRKAPLKALGYCIRMGSPLALRVVAR